MAVKARYNVSLPDHVSAELEKHAESIGATPTEYAGDIIRWWFGQGAPAVRPDEHELRKRIRTPSTELNVWALNSHDMYSITDDVIVQKILDQLGLPNLFVQVAEHDHTRMTVAFDNHPTHWLLIDCYKGTNMLGGDGLAFTAFPKEQYGRKQMTKKLAEIAGEMKASVPVTFSQIPNASASSKV